jgi:hypothetical protein
VLRKFSRGGIEKTGHGLGEVRELSRLSDLWRGNPEKSNGNSRLETTRELEFSSALTQG